MNLEEIIRGIRVSRSLLSEEDLRRLPYKKAFIYARVSSQIQVKESRESIREIAKLVLNAKQDGYKSNLTPDEVGKWLASIQSGADVPRVIEDGEIIIDCQDLGLSGSLGEDKRPGLAHLQRRVESGEVGAVYLTEGMSRLSRDKDRVLGYQLLKLLKVKQCRVRMPEGIYNPVIPRDWDHLADDVDDSADEMKKLGIRLGRRRAAKAAGGEHVGSPVCPGYIVTIKGQKRDGSYVFGKWELYPPHLRVVMEAYEEISRQGDLGQAFKVLWERRLAFPPFPQELRYMETRSALRRYRKDSTGYLISYNALKGLATNLALIGIWQWKDILIENNHPAGVPVDLFLPVYEIATSSKPRGRAAYAEPMDWAGTLHCYDHEEPRKVRALNTQRRWACRSYVWSEPPCLQIADHFLTPPLTRAFLDCLDLTPHAEAVLEKLKSEVSQNNLEDGQRRRRETEIKTHIANLERYLGGGDPQREETYWRLIREERAKLEQLKQTPVAPKATPLDLDRVAHFLENLDRDWERYPGRLRQRLIKLLIDEVQLRHHGADIEATICWKVGLRQVINIRRPGTRFAKERLWGSEEDSLLRMLWPSSSREAIMAAFPGRTWVAMFRRASKLKISRQWVRGAVPKGRRWTDEERQKLRELYTKATVDDIARELGRSRVAIIWMAHNMSLSRPKELRYRRQGPVWEPLMTKLFQQESSRSSSSSRA